MIDCSKTEIYLSEKARMTKASELGVCRIRCVDCPLWKENSNINISCMQLELKHPETAVKIVEEWSNEHPQRTYLTEFLRHYPNVELDESGVPKGICPRHLGLVNEDRCAENNDCVKCWNQSVG